MTWQAISARPYSKMPLTAVITDSRITAVPNGAIYFVGNLNLLKSTGQRHTIDIIRTTVEDCHSDMLRPQPIPIPNVAILIGARVNADTCRFNNNRGVGFSLFAGATGAANNCTMSNNVNTIGAGGISLGLGASASFTGRGLHSFTFRLNVCTVCGIRWLAG